MIAALQFEEKCNGIGSHPNGRERLKVPLDAGEVARMNLHRLPLFVGEFGCTHTSIIGRRPTLVKGGTRPGDMAPLPM